MSNSPHAPFSTLVETLFDAACVVDARGEVVACNEAATAHFEYSKCAIVGARIETLFADADEWKTVRLHANQSLFLQTKNGRTFASQIRVSALDDEHTLFVAREFTANSATNTEANINHRETAHRVLDVHTEQQNIAQQNTDEHHRAVVLETASRVALDILSNRTGVEALRHIADAARILAGARYAALGVARLDESPNPRELREFITVGLTPDEESAIGALPHGHGILGLLLESPQPLRIETLGNHPASSGFPANHPPMKSFLGVPIRRGDLVLGSLYLTNKHGDGHFSHSDETAVQALAAHAAVAIHHLHLQEKQRDLVRALIGAQEEERRSVAYDLHDGLTQFVMASHAHLQAFGRAQQNGKTEKAARELEQGLTYLKEAVLESRRLINGLRTLALDDLGLAGALEQMVAEARARGDCDAQLCDVELSHNIGGRRFDKTLETGVYRIAQESLTNARKHAQSARLRVLVEARDEARGARLHLEVRDWGKGFDLHQKMNWDGHVGLGGMNERAHLLNGTLEIKSVEGEGTRVIASFPLNDEQS